MSYRPAVSPIEKPLRACLKLVQRLMIRTGAGPLRPFWAWAYRLLIRGVTAWIRAISPGATVFLRGGFARGNPAYGLSDVDLIFVTADDRAKALDAQVAALYARLPLTKDIVEASVLSCSGFHRAVTTPFIAWPAGPSAHLLRSAGLSSAGANLAGPLRRWRLLAGEDPLAGRPASHLPEYKSLWAWTDVQFYWKHLFRNCAHPGLHTSRHVTKSALSLAELIVWFEYGQILVGEAEIRRFGKAHPQEQELLDRLLQAQGAISEFVVPLVQISRRIAGRIAEEASRAGGVRVRLHGDVSPSAIPLVDWRARVLPEPPEAFAVIPGDIEASAVLAAAARALDEPGRSTRPAFLSGELFLLPDARRAVARLSPALLRAIHCPATDPVSFALLAGKRQAWFPELPGWAIGHAAARGRAEFCHWLKNEQAAPPGERLAGLFSAARSGLLWESLQDGSPELALTPHAVASHLGSQVADAALEAYHHWKLRAGAEPRRDVVKQFQSLVEDMAAYRTMRARAAVSSRAGD
jgi:hypothetical protein